MAPSELELDHIAHRLSLLGIIALHFNDASVTRKVRYLEYSKKMCEVCLIHYRTALWSAQVELLVDTDDIKNALEHLPWLLTALVDGLANPY